MSISFSFLAGEVLRAPHWMRRVGLEWLHRSWQEPRRLLSRYLVHDAPIAIGLLTSALVHRRSTMERG